MESCACGTTARPTTSLHNCSNFAQTPSFDPPRWTRIKRKREITRKMLKRESRVRRWEVEQLGGPDRWKILLPSYLDASSALPTWILQKKCLACCILIWDNLPLHRRPMWGGKFEYRRNFFVANLNAAIYTRNMCFHTITRSEITQNHISAKHENMQVEVELNY